MNFEENLKENSNFKIFSSLNSNSNSNSNSKIKNQNLISKSSNYQNSITNSTTKSDLSKSISKSKSNLNLNSSRKSYPFPKININDHQIQIQSKSDSKSDSKLSFKPQTPNSSGSINQSNHQKLIYQQSKSNSISPSIRLNQKFIHSNHSNILKSSANSKSSSIKSTSKSTSTSNQNSNLKFKSNINNSLTQSALNHHHQILQSNQKNHHQILTSNSQCDQNSHDDLITQVPDHPELDDQMQHAIQAVIHAHSNQLSNLKRLLSSADHGSSMTMHLLHAEIKLLQDKNLNDQDQIQKLKKQITNLTLQIEKSRSNALISTTAKRGSLLEVLSSSNDQEITSYFKTLSPKTRLHLLHLLLEAAIPGDIASLRKYLEQVERTKRDFITYLPQHLTIRCLLYLDVPSILHCRLVSKNWNNVITNSGLKLWRALALSLTSKDDEPPRPKENSTQGWFELYKGLHYREENWKRGLAQRVVVLKGHTGSIGAIKLRGTTLATGSLDGTLRIWNVRTSSCLKIVKMPAPVSSLDFYGQYGPTGVIAAGGNDVGRVFLISMNGTLLNTLSGHNKGIRTLAMNSNYLVSGGYDKALVVWNWKDGTRIVKFGQQTNPCAAISLFGSTFSSVQVDGVIRCFNIISRELLSQHKVQGHERGTEKLGGEMFQWFVAEARRVIIATKTNIFQLEYNLGDDGLTVDLSSPPRLVSLTPIVHELNTGTLDVLKRRFAAAPRFATRLGDDMRIFIGHLPEYANEVRDDGSDDLQPIEGAWLAADSSVSQRNPTCMSLSSDQLVVGCSDGILYALDFCGTDYRSKQNHENGTNETQDERDFNLNKS